MLGVSCSVNGLTAVATNVAVPRTNIREDARGNPVLSFYVQFSSSIFLSAGTLATAVKVGILRNVSYANLTLTYFNLVSLYISVVCNHATLQTMVLPYSEKLSREKTFAYLWLFWGVASFDMAKTKVFSMKVVLFTNLKKFPLTKVSLYTVLYY